MSNTPGLADFNIGLVNSVINLPDGQVKSFEEFKLASWKIWTGLDSGLDWTGLDFFCRGYFSWGGGGGRGGCIIFSSL